MLSNHGTCAVIMKWNRMGQTLQYRVEKAGVAHIRHSIRDSLLFRAHQIIYLFLVRHLFELAFEIFLIFFPLLPFSFKLLSALRSNDRSLWLLIKLFEPKEARTVIIRFKHRLIIMFAAPILMLIKVVPVFVLTHLTINTV